MCFLSWHSIAKEAQIFAIYLNKSTSSLKEREMLFQSIENKTAESLYSWEGSFSLRLAAKFQKEGRLWCWIKFDMCHCFGKDGTHQNYGFCVYPDCHAPPHGYHVPVPESHDIEEVYFSFLAIDSSSSPFSYFGYESLITKKNAWMPNSIVSHTYLASSALECTQLS